MLSSHAPSQVRFVAGLPRLSRRSLVALVCASMLTVGAFAAETPGVGAKAPDFGLLTETGAPVRLSSLTGKGKVVLVILRGYPGYDCPFCTKQVHDFVEHSAAFAAKSTNVLLVYPGPPADLDAHAKAFLTKQANLPPNIQLVLDPDYKVTDLYGLRWDAPRETAYPSTFILKNGVVTFAKVSRAHGDRMSAQDALAQLGD